MARYPGITGLTGHTRRTDHGDGDHRPGDRAEHREADRAAHLAAHVQQAGGHPRVRLGHPAAAKTHVSRAMLKLGARDRAQLVVFAYQAGLVTPRSAGR